MSWWHHKRKGVGKWKGGGGGSFDRPPTPHPCSGCRHSAREHCTYVGIVRCEKTWIYASCRELESGSGCTSDPVSTRATTRRSWRGETTRGCALTMRTPPRWGQNRSFYRVDPAAASTPETAARRATAKQLCVGWGVGVVGKLYTVVCACRTEKGRKGASSATTPTLRQHNTTQPRPVRSRGAT